MKLTKAQAFVLIAIVCTICLRCSKENDEFPIPSEPYEITGSGLRVGVSVTDITPSGNITLEGYEPRESDGIHDPLTARSLTIIDKNDEVIILIALDLIGMYQDQIVDMREIINAFTGLEESTVFIHAIHTHSGPQILANPDSQKNYLSWVNKKIGQSVRYSLETSKNAIAILKKGQSSVLAVNRRNPERAVENNFTTIQFVDPEQNTIGTLINFACHPVVLGPDNKKITADYVHYLRASIEQSLGGTAIFFNGKEGDINPPAIHPNYQYDRSGGTFEMSEQFGRQISMDILDPVNEVDTAEIEINIMKKTIPGGDGLRNTEISIVDFGMSQIAMVPGEPLSEMGNIIEGLLPGQYPMIFGMTNDFIGYIIPNDDWEGCSHSFISSCYEETVSPGESTEQVLMDGYAALASDMFP